MEMILITKVSTGVIFPGTWVLNNGNKFKIVAIDKDNSSVTLDDESMLPINIAEKNVITHLAKDGKNVYEVHYTSYDRLRYSKTGDILDYSIITIKNKVYLGNLVRIVDLKIIDTMELFNQEERFALVSKIKEKTYILDFANPLKGCVEVKRYQFAIANGCDESTYVKLK
ncbi:hypothetical protein DSECCO2_120470 [anaerobic digester metagenome]